MAGGCATQPQKLQVCPGKATVAEALQTLSSRAEHAVGLRANGHAVLTYHVPNKKKAEKHGLPMELLFDPPADIYLQGSVAVDPKAVIMGSNEREFWLTLRPREISSYYLGQWQDVGDSEGLTMSPRGILEALGVVIEPAATLNAAVWTLKNEGPYDVLTRRDEAGRTVKRVYVYACDYSVRKVEYSDGHGKVAAVAQLEEYQPVVEGFAVPTRIDIVSTGPGGRKDSLSLSLNSVKTIQFKEKQRQAFFRPPSADRFEHIYHYEEGRWVPEP
ncbi:MAG: hypothetical protein NTZ17_13000 [Phycisphaerae bacterium]|nr:hypothetical protein [Phycisphaerae bacterium]